MPTNNIKKLAKNLGATIGDPVHVPSDGAFGAAHLAAVLSARLRPSQGKGTGRPSDPAWNVRAKVPMKQETLARLEELASSLSSKERKISAMQLAAQLLEKSLEQVHLEDEKLPV